MGTRRQFSREFKFEAVRLVKELEGAVAQAARDLDVRGPFCSNGYVSSRVIRSRRSLARV